MNKIKIAISFLKIRLHKIGNLLFKTATAYVVAGFATIQVSSIVVSNISLNETFGISSESFMQFLFIFILVGFPIVLVFSYIYKSKNLNADSLSGMSEMNNQLSDKKPKIGIIPFENLNNEGDGDFLVDGIVEDLITELSMIKELSVATRKTCFGFRDKDYTSGSFKKEWGFDYVVSGSIRASEERIRISVELSDMTDDKVIWSNKYEKVKKDIFELQDEIVLSLVNSINSEIEVTSLKRAYRKPTESMTSYEFTLKGRALNQRFEKEANAEALKMLDSAIEADKLNPLPYSWKACTLGQAMFLGFLDRNEETMATFLETLSKANEMNDNDWNTNRILAEAHLTLNDFNQTKAYATKAYKANPSNPHVLSIYGDALLRNDEIENAIKIFEKMYELEPIVGSDINSDRPLRSIFFAYYLNRDFKKCKELFALMDEIDVKTWLTYTEIYKSNNANPELEKWYEKGYNDFKDLNWKEEINAFHLNNKELKNNLISLSSSLRSL